MTELTRLTRQQLLDRYVKALEASFFDNANSEIAELEAEWARRGIDAKAKQERLSWQELQRRRPLRKSPD